MRLIDADELIRSGAWSAIITQTQYDKMIKVIDQLPTIDAVLDIVCCKDCWYQFQWNEGGNMYCELYDTLVYATDYCSRGERRSE